jgi:predicted amidophosphoribosyltransferase
VSAQAPAVTQPEAWPRDLCPLCQAPLRPDQSWCLRCGAAARTRLAAQPKWKALLVVMLLIVVLSLAVLAAALVKLAG